MKSHRRDEIRWSDRASVVAACVALPVSAAATAATLIVGDIATLAGILSIVVPGIAAAIVTGIAVQTLLIRRHRTRDRAANRRLSTVKRELRDEKEERSLLRELDAAIDLAANEEAAIDLVREAFTKHLAMQPMELHLVHPVDPVLELVVATGDHATKDAERCNPWDSLAARKNATLVYDTTDRLDACAHLTSRLHKPMSAAAVPINAMGRLLGVLYALGPEGQKPSAGDVRLLEDFAALIGARLAILRASIHLTGIDDVDRLTGLPDRAAMQERVLRMLSERQPFTVAVADIDDFGRLNDDLGRNVGDRALQLLGHVARRTIRPRDIIGRIGGDEFLFILPQTSADDATRAFERLREELVLSQASTDDPAFTLSIGVVGSTSGGSIEEILHRGANALDYAKSQGGNRVVVAHTKREMPRTR